MKRSKLVLVAAATIAVQSLGIWSAHAQTTFKAFVNAIAISTNVNGQLTYHEYDNDEIIRACVGPMGITNLTGISLVYDRMADALEVVSGTNKTVLCTPLTFSGGLSLSNTNGTRIERQADITVEGSSTPSGTLAATEFSFTNPSNSITSFVLSGRLQYIGPASGTNGPTLYRGSLLVGSGFFSNWGD